MKLAYKKVSNKEYIMRIKVKGGTKSLRAELDEAARFFGKILLHGRTYKHIDLDIDIYKKYDVLGECIDEEDTTRPRMFTINIRTDKNDKLDPDCDPVRILAHEMVHLKQHVIGELRSGCFILNKKHKKGDGLRFVMATKWQGKVWRPTAKQDEYYDAPWEIEAFGREVGLHMRWLEHKKGMIK